MKSAKNQGGNSSNPVNNIDRVVGCQYESCRIPLQSGTCHFWGDFGLAFFWPIQAVFVVRVPLCDVGSVS